MYKLNKLEFNQYIVGRLGDKPQKRKQSFVGQKLSSERDYLRIQFWLWTTNVEELNSIDQVYDPLNKFKKNKVRMSSNKI